MILEIAEAFQSQTIKVMNVGTVCRADVHTSLLGKRELSLKEIRLLNRFCLDLVLLQHNLKLTSGDTARGKDHPKNTLNPTVIAGSHSSFMRIIKFDTIDCCKHNKA